MYGGQRLAITTAKNLDRAKDMVEFYQPRNSTQEDWEEALAEADPPKITARENREDSASPNHFTDDDLPWPGEGIQQHAG